MIPNCKEKYTSKSVITAKDTLDYLKKHAGYKPVKPVPTAAILSFTSSERDAVLSDFNFEQIQGLYSNIFLVRNGKKETFVVAGLNAGAPHAAMGFETLIAMGVRRFISVGICGAISNLLNPGDIVVCTKAIRDEGTSYHYLKPSKFASPSKSLTDELESNLKRYECRYFKGPTWTIDSIFRETEAEVKKYKKEGILTVEMEASALFSVAKFWNVDIAAVFVVSDHLEEDWEPHFHNEIVSKNLELVHKVAFETLTIK